MSYQRFKARPEYKDKCVVSYLNAMANMAKSTFKTAGDRLSTVPSFAKDKYFVSADALFESIKEGKLDKYDVLNSYVAYIKKTLKKSDNRTRQLVKALRQLMEFNAIEISQTTFRTRVRLPRKVARQKNPVDKTEIVAVLQACPDIKIRTFLLLIASTSMRPIEACSLLHEHIDLKSSPPRITIRAEYTKMKVERFVFITQELADQLKQFMEYKLRQRWQKARGANGEYEQLKVAPVYRQNDLLFAPYRRDGEQPEMNSIYTQMLVRVEQLLGTLNMNQRVGNGQIRKFHFYSLRRYAKTTVSNLGFGDFAEWMLGHSGSTYYDSPEKELVKVWQKVEGYLLFLDTSAYEAHQADLQTQVNSLEQQLAEERAKNKKFIIEEVKKEVGITWGELKGKFGKPRIVKQKKDDTK